MAQDTTPAIEVYQGDGSNNTFSVHFDKGYYGEIKVAFVKRGLTDYEYDPDTYTVSGRLYAWASGDSMCYTHTSNPAIGAPIYTEQDIDTGMIVTEISGITITAGGRTYTRAQQHDISNNVILTWTGDTLEVGDYICIVRETERGQPYEFPANQKQIEGALDNIERQVQELKAKTDNALLVDPTRIADISLMDPVQWMETILRSIDLSVRELRYYDGWLQYSLDDPKSDSEDKTWYSLLNTTNIKSIYYKYTEDEQGRPLYNVYYVDNTDTERLLTYDAQAQQDDINKLKEDVEINAQNIEAEKQVRREADEALRQYIDQKTFDVTQFDSRITQNTNDISALDNRLHETVTALDPAMPKSYIDDRVAGMYHIKGAVDTVDDLPATGNEVGDCWNVIATAKTYLWTEDEEWVLMGDVVDLSPYRTAADQDVIDATKQDILTGSEYIDITNDVVTMTGKFGTSFTTSGTNLILKDQDNNTLSETMLSVGVDAEYTAADEDIEFDTGATSDYSFITERLYSIEAKIPDNASSTNKFATADDIGDATLTIQRNNTTVDTFSANATENKTINISVPTTAAEVDALPDTTKYAANMALSINSSTYVVTAQLKDQDGNNLGSAQTIDLPLETVVVSGEYDSENKKIVLTLKDGSTIDIPVGDLIAGLQAEITDDNKLSADLVDDTTTTHKFVTTQDKTNWDNKVTKTTAVSKVYGTDSEGGQTTYDVNYFGAVDDVKVDNVSVVTNKVANIDLTGKADKTNCINGAPLSNTSSNFYGVSTSAATDVEKTVSIPSITTLDVGTVIFVQPTVTSTVASSTLKLNNFPAYPMRYNNAAVSTSTDSIVWNLNYISIFLFDGTYWQFAGHGLDSNTTYTINYTIDAGRYKAGVGTYAVTRYSLLMEKADGTWEKITATNANYSTGTSKNVNTNGFRLNHIRYYNTTAAVANGALIATNTLQNKAASVNLSYSANCGTAPGWAVGDYIYLVGTIGVDGLFYLDTTQWWSNALPNTNDGKLYIRLGIALTATDSTMSFFDDRPIYYHDGTKICEYLEADNKQDKLVSGTNIKTINGESVLGSGDLTVASSVSTLSDVELTDVSDGQVLVYDAANDKWVNDDQHGGVTATYDATTKTITFA